MTTVWFSPICDVVLVMLRTWRDSYERGEVESTCKFNQPNIGIIDKPTRYAHRMSWHPKEFNHLTRIVRAYSKNKPLIEELEKVEALLPKGRLMEGGRRQVTLVFYVEHINEMIKAMEEAKGSRVKTIAEQVKEGGLF